MCEWGDTVSRLVPVPANLSHTGSLIWSMKPIDRCLSRLVGALNNAGILTEACCCGHGKGPATIILHDDTRLTVDHPVGEWGEGTDPTWEPGPAESLWGKK